MIMVKRSRAFGFRASASVQRRFEPEESGAAICRSMSSQLANTFGAAWARRPRPRIVHLVCDSAIELIRSLAARWRHMPAIARFRLPALGGSASMNDAIERVVRCVS